MMKKKKWIRFFSSSSPSSWSNLKKTFFWALQCSFPYHVPPHNVRFLSFFFEVSSVWNNETVENKKISFNLNKTTEWVRDVDDETEKYLFESLKWVKRRREEMCCWTRHKTIEWFRIQTQQFLKHLCVSWLWWDSSHSSSTCCSIRSGFFILFFSSLEIEIEMNALFPSPLLSSSSLTNIMCLNTQLSRR
jgi:hypothetical protein